MTREERTKERLMKRIRIRPSKVRVQAPPFRRPELAPLPGDFRELTALIRELWGRCTYDDRTRLLRALEAASHRIGAQS